MKLTILGSGTCFPELKRSCASYLIEEKGEKIIIDLGRGAISNLLKLKKDLHELDKIFITHMHTDHSSELASLLQLIISTPKKKKLKKKYVIYGPKGIKKDIRNLLKAFHIDNHWNIKRIIVKEITPNKNIKIKNIVIKGVKAKHGRNINCLTFVIKYKNKKILYSGDACYSPELKKHCKNIDLAIIEATGPKEWKVGHMDGEDLGILAKETKIKNLIVTHVANTYLPRVKKDIRKNFNGPVKIAKDLMEVNI